MPVGAEQLAHAVGEEREVIGRDRIRRYPADVVQPVGSQQRDRLARGRLHRKEGDLRVDGAGGPQQAVVTGVRVDLLDVVVGAVDRAALGHQEPPAVEDLRRLLGDAPADPRRFELIHGPQHAFGDPPREERAVVVIRLTLALFQLGAASRCACASPR